MMNELFQVIRIEELTQRKWVKLYLFRLSTFYSIIIHFYKILLVLQIYKLYCEEVYSFDSWQKELGKQRS